MKVNIPYVQAYRSRKRVFYYYRRAGQRIRLHGEPGSQEFMAAYNKAHASFEDATAGENQADAFGTFGYLLTAYYASPEFLQNIKPDTRAFYRRYLDPLKVKWGKIAMEGLTSRVVREWRNKMADKPGTANAALRSLKSMLKWAVKNEYLQANPAEKVDPIKTKSDGWEAWPEASLEKFAGKATGAARVAFMLALHTGQRRKDVLAMRWDAMADGWISVKQSKTGKALEIPVHPVLAAELEAERKRQADRAAERRKKGRPAAAGLTMVQREDGRPYSESGFASIWNRAQHDCECARLPFHGLRKNATQALFEAGCTPQQVQAITGHETLEMVAHYGKKANQRRLAKQAMGRLVNKGGGESV